MLQLIEAALAHAKHLRDVANSANPLVRRVASADYAMAVAPKGADHARHETRCCRGLQSIDVHSR